MKLVRFTHKHLPYVEEMLTLRDMDKAILKDLPQIGYICFHHEVPIAIGFLRRMEGPYAILDSYMTNPHLDADIRNTALDKITESLLYYAKKNNVIKVLAFSLDSNTIQRALRHGFVQHSHVFTSLTL